MKMKNIVIVTDLPFRKSGNQSLMRFVKMFLKNDCKVTLFTTGKDSGGENTLSHPLFELHALGASQRAVKKKNATNTNNSLLTDYNKIQSEDIIMPFTAKGYMTIFRRWAEFTYTLAKSVKLKGKLIKSFDSAFQQADCIIGYEAGLSILAKNIATQYKKPFINKFQGTILAATNRNSLIAKLYYPKLYWGINQSDLCLMVNDGTDGEYWAQHRGCTNIRFRPHGVSISDYPSSVEKAENKKFVIFNNASCSAWKRPDRIVRAMSHLPLEIREKVIFKTTYFGPDRESLINFVKDKGLTDCVEFLDNFDHIDSNVALRTADLVIMVNDMSNLGNPILESIFYNTPFITINDGSVSPFADKSEGGVYIDINKDFDINMAKSISDIVTGKIDTADIRNSLSNNDKVKTLEVEQADEFERISTML